jgi:hypothetical protein
MDILKIIAPYITYENIVKIVDLLILIQIRMIMMDHERIRRKETQISDLREDNDNLKKELDRQRKNLKLQDDHYGQLIESYRTQEGELRAYKQIILKNESEVK